MLSHFDYAHVPGVGPAAAALAPVSVSKPPSFSNLAATDEATTEVTTLCFHVRSLFFAKSTKQFTP